jgi:hypothetical protein
MARLDRKKGKSDVKWHPTPRQSALRSDDSKGKDGIKLINTIDATYFVNLSTEAQLILTFLFYNDTHLAHNGVPATTYYIDLGLAA